MALPDYSRGSGFYNPGASYQGTFGNMNVQKQIPGLYQTWGTEENPQGVWQQRLAKLGLGGTGARAKTAQGMYGESQAGYKAAQTTNYELMYPEYLDTVEVDRILGNMSYNQQGLNPGQFQDRYRWGQRG